MPRPPGPSRRPRLTQPCRDGDECGLGSWAPRQSGALAAGGWWVSQRPTTRSADASGQVIQTIRSGDIAITLVSDAASLHQGRNTFAIEFRSATTGALIDVGDVRFAAAMTMPGMVMSGGAEISRTIVPGRYAATGEFGMAGIWRMTIEWNGPAGRGSAAFDGDVR